jgi:hypothetical protein
MSKMPVQEGVRNVLDIMGRDLKLLNMLKRGAACITSVAAE